MTDFDNWKWLVRCSVAALLHAALCSSAAAAQPLRSDTAVGPARVIDGDTIEVHGERIRLFGIDAPELRQVCHTAEHPWACGEEARAALSRIINGRLVSCIEKDRDRYGRMVAQCLVSAPSADLSQEMVRGGHAVAFTRYSDRYVRDEWEAKAAKAGMWRGEFDRPEDWRAAHKR